ncbi:hypothetical protein GCM10009733_072210 [Nonomuraea maheshkhaliensis]|uniref:Uncharacterized protein n=1 Tax=Nonomuraea maheshkhaliensis TaxID=419590 RepID=A0ABP4S018_9ACTN
MQRAGDLLLTRPVFLPAEAMDDPSHWLPREAWAIQNQPSAEARPNRTDA